MTAALTRRDFLKLTSSAALASALGGLPLSQREASGQEQARPNIIMVLFDALSAHNLSLYGYPRQTSPNIERLASISTVYHNHQAAGNFTTPSTASLFTGTYPWTHRALNLSSLISPQIQAFNVFRLLDEAYHQAAFAQNTFADMLLYQFNEHLDRHESVDSFSLAGRTYYDNLFKRDAITGMQSTDQFLFKREEAHGSLFFSILNDLATQLSYKIQSIRLEADYPSGPARLANTDVYFHSSQVMDGVLDMLSNLPEPSFTYLHFMPPHMPYTPRRQFSNLFDDGWAPPEKKKHRLAPGVPQKRLDQLRLSYDQFVADLDYEFGRLLERLEVGGQLDNSVVIFSSDHGELFERGVSGHSTPLVFQPLVHIPLVIHAPGQRQRVDVQSLTSNVDLLPTIAQIAGLPSPERCEGRPLPGLGGVEGPDRGIFVVEAKANPAYQRLRKATLVLMRGAYKLVHYLGYKNYPDAYEFYDLENDPDELHNLYPEAPLAREMQTELDEELERVNRQYR